jgi:uncharacterized lipoprotein YmbA
MPRTILIVIAIAAIGCASAPQPRYYTLDMAPSGALASRYNVHVDRLRPHDALTRNEILIKKSSTEVEYYALDRWVQGLGELVTEKLNAEFGAKTNDRETLVVSGEILAFEQVDTPDGAESHIKLDLSIWPDGVSRYDKPLYSKTYETRVPTPRPTPGATVEALSRGLNALAAEIAADAGRLEIPAPEPHK